MGTKNNPGDFDCYANAKPDEPMFILLARDPLAPYMVRMWADKRWSDFNLDRSPKTPGERAAEGAKVNEARALAAEMDEWRSRHV